MLEGKIVPRPLSSLASVIVVSFIGSGKLPKRWLHSTFHVRRQRVWEVLCWLKQHNPLYRDINIDEERLAALPDDDVPIEIMATIRQSSDNLQAARESDSYVPNHEPESQAGQSGGRFEYFVSFYFVLFRSTSTIRRLHTRDRLNAQQADHTQSIMELGPPCDSRVNQR